MLAEDGEELGDRRTPLADRAVHAQHVLVPLFQDRIQRDGRLPCLAVPENQLSLPAADGQQRIDYFDLSL
jgi:hypothetical protein